MSFLLNLLRIFKKEAKKEEPVKERIVLFIVPLKSYQTELIEIIKSASERFNKTLYISLNKPVERIMEELKSSRIDNEKFLFIDAVNKEVKEGIGYHNIAFINSPENFEKFKLELSQLLLKERVDCIIFDSLNTLLVYQEQSAVVRFMHDFIRDIIVANLSGCIIYAMESPNSSIIKDVAMFVDKVVETGKKEELNVETPDKKKGIAKLENELDSVRQAFASKLISEESYLNTKSRVEKNLKKLINKK